jgi:hypothetical protein
MKLKFITAFSGLLLFLSLKIYATNPKGCDSPNCFPSPARLAAGTLLAENKKLQTFDVITLNLKNNGQQNSVQQVNSAISITLADFNSIAAAGNTWLLYKNSQSSFSMNIGTANNASPQTWTLPSNLLTYFTGAGRSDFLAPASVPVALQIAGANRVMRTPYFDVDDRLMDVYDHFNINSSAINHLGTSYDLEAGADDNFNEPDYEYSDVPLDLNDSFSSTIEDEDYYSNLTLAKYITTSTVDAFGTISTPDGTFNCLRISHVIQKYTRPDEITAYTLVGTSNSVTFVSKEGQYFNAATSAVSGTVNLSDFQYRKIVLTTLLAESNDVKINNNSKGVSINIDDDTPHPSAILDVKSNNLGILIPRIAMANRPINPATGLLIYQIDNTAGFYFYDGTNWRMLTANMPASMTTNARTNDSEIRENWSIRGKNQLKNGSTFIKFDQPREDFENLNVNLTSEGDCNGLYISKKTREGFEVRELQKGKSNVKFSWKLD